MKSLRWLAAAIGLGAISSPTGAASSPQPVADHAVIVCFNYGSTDLSRLFELEGKLENAIIEANAGYMYGPDADRLFQNGEPILKATPFMSGATVTVRYGPPADGTHEREVTFAP